MPNATSLNMPPHERWDLIIVGVWTFTPMAKHIFIQACSTSLCEWNWSSYSFVHNKMHNHLTFDQVVDLVYIYTNSKLLREWLGAIPTTCYEKNMLSEDSTFNINSIANSQAIDDFEGKITDDFNKHKFNGSMEITLKTSLGTPTIVHLN